MGVTGSPSNLLEVGKGIQDAMIYGCGQIHVLLNKTRSEHFKALPFADGEVQSTTQTKYLVIKITEQGIIP